MKRNLEAFTFADRLAKEQTEFFRSVMQTQPTQPAKAKKARKTVAPVKVKRSKHR